MATQPEYSVDALLQGRDPSVARIYKRLVATLKSSGLGRVVEDPKKTCIHLVAGPDGSAFAGVHCRKAAILLNIKSQAPIRNARIRRSEQLSRSRHHNELVLLDAKDVDAELLGWLSAAYALSVAPAGTPASAPRRARKPAPPR